jgi:hypothetical protein
LAHPSRENRGFEVNSKDMPSYLDDFFVLKNGRRHALRAGIRRDFEDADRSRVESYDDFLRWCNQDDRDEILELFKEWIKANSNYQT